MEDNIKTEKSSRIQSIDIARGLTILVMLFVNDLAGVNGAPAWMKHVHPSTADGMTFVDVVFPAFLFIVGLSLPIALERRFSRGSSRRAVSGHILTRAAALLIIGVLMVNTGNISDNGLLHPRLWSLLLYAAVCLVWIEPATSKQRAVWVRKIAGMAMLAALALLYRGEPGMIGLRPQWWGILGLIGWAYLVAGLLYILLRRNTPGFAAAVALLYMVYLADSAGFFALFHKLAPWMSIGSVLGSHAAITASGALLSLMLFSEARPHRQRIRSALIFAAVLAAAGILLHSLHAIHPMFIYNKNAATPPWCLLSSAWTALIFALIYWFADSRGISRGTRMLSAAGQNALFAFILGPITYILLELLPPVINGMTPYNWLGAGFATGLFRSLVFAFAATWLTARLQRSGYALRI